MQYGSFFLIFYLLLWGVHDPTSDCTQLVLHVLNEKLQLLKQIVPQYIFIHAYKYKYTYYIYIYSR